MNTGLISVTACPITINGNTSDNVGTDPSGIASVIAFRPITSNITTTAAIGIKADVPIRDK